MAMTLEQAYELGWRRSAEWSKRDDLLSDIDSPAYKRDRDEDLAHLSAQAKVQAVSVPPESMARSDALRAVRKLLSAAPTLAGKGGDGHE